MAYAFGIDIGGAFTDIVCRGDDGSPRIAKPPTTRDDPSRTVLEIGRMRKEVWERIDAQDQIVTELDDISVRAAG